MPYYYLNLPKHFLVTTANGKRFIVYNPVGLLGLGPLHVNRCINIQPLLTKELRNRQFSSNPT